jgi:hypothetical protein
MKADVLQLFHHQFHGIDEHPRQGLITGVNETTKIYRQCCEPLNIKL